MAKSHPLVADALEQKERLKRDRENPKDLTSATRNSWSGSWENVRQWTLSQSCLNAAVGTTKREGLAKIYYGQRDCSGDMVFAGCQIIPELDGRFTSHLWQAFQEAIGLQIDMEYSLPPSRPHGQM
ncbi:hypothetical protein Tco_1378620 [Tanacetum coccineum]